MKVGNMNLAQIAEMVVSGGNAEREEEMCERWLRKLKPPPDTTINKLMSKWREERARKKYSFFRCN